MDSQRPSGRRHTTFLDNLGAVRVLGNPIASFGRQLIVGNPEFDQDKYYENFVTQTRRSKRYTFRGPPPSFRSVEQRSSIDFFSNIEDPFDDHHAIRNFEEKKQREQPKFEEEPYHIATRKEKWVIIITISVAGLFSGLSSNTYFPLLDAIAKDLGVTLAAVSLTITSYLIIQGISPVIWGAFSDTVGRRPIYIVSFVIYIFSNVVLSFTPNYAVLVIFKGLQAAGSASTVSIGNGVIQDIAPPSERGAFISFYQAIRNISIAIGPILGGALCQSFGFRSVFVFLLITSTIVLLVIIMFLPETMRHIAGNGTIRLDGIYWPLIRKFRKEPSYMTEPDDAITTNKVTFLTFIEPLKLLKEKDVLCNLIFGGAIYAVWSMVVESTTALFKENFGLTELLLGVAFLPNEGVGTIFGSAIAGKLMTEDYREAERSYKTLHGFPPDYKIPPNNIPTDFPTEHARFRHLPWISILFIVSTGAYGFSLAFPTAISMRGWIAVPLFLQFLIAATSNAVFCLNQTLGSDLSPGKGASATAINNLVRCALGAIGVAVIDKMIDNMGPALTFLGLSFIVISLSPMPVIVWCFGPGWRLSKAAARKQNESKISNSTKGSFDG
ncbi:hypothetical protein HYFRA_00012360 [Hymenoscyphus fraxineus]|uniref:Major facilitator superfamily (MFS) profile domain-containing protein n=1 Tax=Hymenoscyphus fraxineus TaxID=746836 RepID=A0A9N9KYR4_9HELO|nr:hypothetical protein HYFRA_00012360 [Hymenoscyphus fraxineus]